MSERADAHIHLFEGGYCGSLAGRPGVQLDEVALYSALAAEHGVRCALVVGYAGEPWCTSNNAWIAAQARKPGTDFAALALKLIESERQPGEGHGIVKRPVHKPHALRQTLPNVFTKRGPGVFPDRVVNDLREIFVSPIATREAYESEPGRQKTTVGQVVNRGHQFTACQVTRDSENHQSARSRDAR